MSYLDAYIEPCPAYGWEGGGEFLTEIVELASGRERRNAKWSTVRHKYRLPFRNIGKDAYRAIKSHHLVCRGRLHAFRYKDPLDHEATSEIFGTGDGVTTVFQLAKLSEVDGIVYRREVFAVVAATITVNGVAAAPTVDLRRGTVTFAAAPAAAAVLRWTGTFDVWVRFDQDYLPFSLDNARGDERFMNGSVDLIELPPPAPGDD